MKTIQPFIDLGWHTVPLRGELRRLEDGTKTVPKFEKDWKDTYQHKFNTVASPLGGTITGEVSGIIAIDCDCTLTYQLFRSLDPDYEFVFKSQGKLDKEGNEKDCGTIVYKYDANCPETFSVNDGMLALDVYADRGFVYLPTEANKTKVAWADTTPTLREAPPAVTVLLKQLNKARDGAKAPEAAPVLNVITANCLQPLVESFASDRKFMPGLFKIITPKDFRDLPEYIEHGYLDPSCVPDGRGSEYLSKVSAILGADISINEELYVKAMHAINALFDTPIASSRLDSTVIDPMVEKKASINGVPIWKYEESWKEHRCVLQSKRQASLELCFDDVRNMYYVVDAANETSRSFSRDTELMAYVNAASRTAPKKAEVLRSIPIVNVKAEPNKAFGFSSGDDPTARNLNLFKQTPELAIMSDPSVWMDKYKVPTTTLKFFETLVPEEEMREFLLGFTKRKLTTFEYSPVILFFLGVHGSGKDTYVQILEQIIGHVARPTTREFLEMFNGWLLDSYVVQLDEYGNQLTRISDREEALGKLKAYSGKTNIQIRQMRTDGFMYHHNATFILTANSNPLMLEDGDRRIALCPTPNVLAEQEWVLEAGGISQVYQTIMSETKDFAYYLATQVPMLSDALYMKPPESKQKREVIASSMYAAQRIAYCLKHAMKDHLLELCEDHSATKTAKAINSGRIHTEEMEELYDAMTDYNGDMKSLNKACRGMGIDLIPTTLNGQKSYYYKTQWADVQTSTWEDEEG